MNRVLIQFFVLFWCLSYSSAQNLNWNLNDVSILYPIPQKPGDTADYLLGPASSGSKGALISLEIYKKIPPINADGVDVVYQNELKLISIRVDPCPNTFDNTKCQPEIRLVWQPIVLLNDASDPVKPWVALDSAIHTFYKLSFDEFNLFKNEAYKLKMENLKNSVDTANVPLQIHPAFLVQKTRSAFLNKMNALVLNFCGSTNLHKVTFTSLLTQNVWWRFGGIELHDKTWEQIKIPRVNMTFEDIFNTAPETNAPIFNSGTEMDSVFNIFPNDYPKSDDLHPVINKGFRFNTDEDLAVFKTKMDAVARFRNPHSTNPTNLDCASCHYADNSKYYMVSRFGELKNYFSAVEFKNPNPSLYNLENKTLTQKSTRVVRAFGYFENREAISQRTINDSAESAQWLNLYGK